MPDSKRLQVKKALTELLEGITTANGYNFDLADKVWRGRTRIGEESQAPFLVIFEVIPEGPDVVGGDLNRNLWDVAVKGYIEADTVHPTDPADNLMADVKKCLYQIADSGGGGAAGPNFMLGGLVADMEVDNGVTFSPDDTTNMAYFAMKITFTFTESLENPYGT